MLCWMFSIFTLVFNNFWLKIPKQWHFPENLMTRNTYITIIMNNLLHKMFIKNAESENMTCTSQLYFGRVLLPALYSYVDRNINNYTILFLTFLFFNHCRVVHPRVQKWKLFQNWPWPFLTGNLVPFPRLWTKIERLEAFNHFTSTFLSVLILISGWYFFFR